MLSCPIMLFFKVLILFWGCTRTCSRVLLCSFSKSWFCFGGVLEHALVSYYALFQSLDFVLGVYENMLSCPIMLFFKVLILFWGCTRTCSRVLLCSFSKSCANGVCVSDVTGLACANGVCVSDVTGLACANGVCASDVTDLACANGVCASDVTDLACANGVCVSDVTGLACANGVCASDVTDLACANGVCASDVTGLARAIMLFFKVLILFWGCTRTCSRVLLCSFSKSWFCFGGVLEHALVLGGSKIALFVT